jgi:hypothetical protein
MHQLILILNTHTNSICIHIHVQLPPPNAKIEKGMDHETYSHLYYIIYGHFEFKAENLVMQKIKTVHI